jgi:hypothetical protein
MAYISAYGKANDLLDAYPPRIIQLLKTPEAMVQYTTPAYNSCPLDLACLPLIQKRFFIPPLLS